VSSRRFAVCLGQIWTDSLVNSISAALIG
jgi:hypothetical protein